MIALQCPADTNKNLESADELLNSSLHTIADLFFSIGHEDYL